MGPVAVSRVIDAPVDRVFSTIADVETFARAVPDIADVEFVSERRSGVGTVFRETRVMRGRHATSELEVTEYVENELIRLVSDEGGTIWDSVFTVAPIGGGGTRLDLVMDARPHTLTARVVNWLTRSIIRRSIEGDMDAVKAYCEVTAV